MATDDPELPEILRMAPPADVSDSANVLQRSMSMVSIGPDQSGDTPTTEQPPTQNMSISDEEMDWAEQMRQESDDRARAETKGREA